MSIIPGGDKVIDVKILSYLNDEELINFCKTHKNIYSICTNKYFWINKILTKFPKLNIEIIGNNYSVDYFEDLSKINSENYKNYLIPGSKTGKLDYVIVSLIHGSSYLAIQLALYWSIINGYIEIVKYLINNGGNINDELLIVAIDTDHLELVKYLIDKSDSVTISCTEGYLWLISSDHSASVKYFKNFSKSLYKKI